MGWVGRSQICRKRTFAETNTEEPELNSHQQEVARHIQNGKGMAWIIRNCKVTEWQIRKIKQVLDKKKVDNQ
jgi:hypothetical protein